MRYYVENHDEVMTDINSEIEKKYNGSIMISRKERNKRKKSIRFKGGRRYKKSETGLKKILLENCNSKYFTVIVLVSGMTYICSNMYFKYHFYTGTTINCINVSFKSIEDAEKYIGDSIDNYKLILKGRGGVINVIDGKDIALGYNYEINSIKEKQNEISWIKSFFDKDTQEGNHILITYDEKLLNNAIECLDIFKEDNIITPENPKFIYSNNEFVIEDEIYGSKIDKDILIEKIKKSILDGQEVLDLEKEGCYENPEYTKSSEKALRIKDILNQYKDSKVIYDLGNLEKEINMSTMEKWINIDNSYNVTINRDEVMDFVNEFADKYDTVGISRTMNSTSGRIVTVAGGDYGFKINRVAETEELINNLKGKNTVKREPIYEQKGINTIINDVDKTCVEIDLSNQHLWFYKDGIIFVEGDVVSGSIANGTITPEGTYSLKYKDKDSVLVGEGYRSPVDFWMPFNGNIGMHDAGWRYNFGGKIYLTNGSHGCINLPHSLAKNIFYNIEEGTPVVCYY